MKTTALATLVLIALLGPCAAQASQSSTAVAARHLTHKQAMQLLYTANTAEDHRALAQYFRQEAQRKRDKEQYYWEVASTYRLHPPRVDTYRNGSSQGQYQQLADAARDEAFFCDRMATLQERFAEGLATPK